MSDSQKRYSSVDDYIASQVDAVKPILEKIRFIIKTAAPDAQEVISYQMPGYQFHGKLIWFAATKNHCGVYVVPRILDHFRSQLSDFHLTKSAIQIPYHQAIPEKIITAIIKKGVEMNLNQKILKENFK
jgi:uncharacterized protein YdhG (YjbR/CyaY superfamily)